MRKKLKMIVPTVTTKEALYSCAKNNVSVFCVEKPLYGEVCKRIRFDAAFFCYKMKFYKNRQCIILKKIFGKGIFRSSLYEPWYPPLEWDN